MKRPRLWINALVLSSCLLLGSGQTTIYGAEQNTAQAPTDPGTAQAPADPNTAQASADPNAAQAPADPNAADHQRTQMPRLTAITGKSSPMPLPVGPQARR